MPSRCWHLVAAHRSKRQIEELVAELSPQPDVPSVMRKFAGSVDSEGSDSDAGKGPTASGRS